MFRAVAVLGISRRASIYAIRGVALVIVMWLVAALSVLVTALIAGNRADLRGAVNQRLFIEHAAMGDAAIRQAALQLKFAAERPDRPFVSSVDFAGHTLNVTAIPAAGFINLNAASAELLEALFIYGAGLPEGDAVVLASRILDWRDADDAVLPSGAESEQYIAAGSRFLPRGGPFSSTDDLVQVLGVGLDIHDRIRSLVTVHGGMAGVDPRFAPAGVLTVLAKGRSDTVDRILAARQVNQTAIDTTALEQQFLASTSDSLYRMEATRTVDGMRLSRVLWIDLAVSGRGGLPWRELAAEDVRAVAQE
ncbi:general secretion pathway protein GspK [Pseudothauera hydrothermalis]|uniref:general secretion pathway protein GspK n=1 Tax=Pseudothauera hydrothermalis TaxID=2184083 RepID=UPI000E08F72E|nr:type II secretion system protein GspK [Pseudothauera hydrothermalis]